MPVDTAVLPPPVWWFVMNQFVLSFRWSSSSSLFFSVSFCFALPCPFPLGTRGEYGGDRR